MHALILSSRCTEEQRNALTVLRGCLEAHGDVCEALDWLSFLPALWIALAALSATGIVILVVYKARRRREEDR